MRTGMLLLGLALGILWIVGLSEHATAWLVWLDFAVAALSVLAAVVPIEPMGKPTSASTSTRSLISFRAPPLGLCAMLAAVWIAALAVGATPFMAWWTLAFAVAYGLLGIFSTRIAQVPTTTFPTSPTRA